MEEAIALGWDYRKAIRYSITGDSRYQVFSARIERKIQKAFDEYEKKHGIK